MTSRSAALAACGVAALLVFISSLANEFAYDDLQIIARNPRVTDASQAGGILLNPYWEGRATGGLYRPATIASFALNHRLHGLDPFGYHLVNVLLHVAVTILLVLLARRFLPPGAALAAGLLFAVHPVHTEAVANVVGRAELLASLGFMAGLLFHLKAADGGSGRTGLWVRVAAVLSFALGLFAKEVAIGLPASLLFIDLIRRRRPDWVAYAGYAAVLVIFFGLRRQVLGGFLNPPDMITYRVDNVIATLPAGAALWTALSVAGRYLGLLFFPLRLSADYSYPQIEASGPGDWRAWAGLAGLVALAVAAARTVLQKDAAGSSRTAPEWGLGLGATLFLVTWLPVSNLVIRIGTVMGERLLYLPSAGFILALSALGWGLHRRLAATGRRFLIGTVAVLVMAGGARSAVRNPDWKNDAVLMTRTVETSPRSARAHYNHAVVLYDAGRLEESVAALEHAVELDPTYTEAWVNLGGYLTALGRLPEARVAFTAAVDTDSTWASALVGLGGLELMAGEVAAARDHLSRAIRLEPAVAEAWFNRGLVRLALADTIGAIDDFREASRLDPADPETHNNLAWYLAISGGSLEEARGHAERAVALDPAASSFDTLAEIHFRNGNPGAAREYWERALAAGAPDADVIREKLRRLPRP